jgi:hypothetical protein
MNIINVTSQTHVYVDSFFFSKNTFNSSNASLPKTLSRYANLTKMESLLMLLFYFLGGWN